MISTFTINDLPPIKESPMIKLAYLLAGIVSASIVFAVTPNPPSGLSAREALKVRTANTDTMEMMGEVFAAVELNSDLMMRFSHHTDNHIGGVPCCPECFGSEIADRPLPTVSEEKDTKPYATLLDDSVELYMGMRNLRGSLQGQETALRHTLKKLREGNRH